MIKPFKFFAQRVMPCVIDGRLSYLETLYKVAYKLNEVITLSNTTAENVQNFEAQLEANLSAFFDEVKQYVEGQNNATIESVNQKLSEFTTFINTTVETLNSDVESAISANEENVATQLSNTTQALTQSVNDTATALRNDVATSVAEMQAFVNSTDTELRSYVEGRVTNLEQQFATASSEISAIDGKVDAFIEEYSSKVLITQSVTGEATDVAPSQKAVSDALKNLEAYNLIVNGDFQIDQRHNAPITANNLFVLDRWKAQSSILTGAFEFSPQPSAVCVLSSYSEDGGYIYQKVLSSADMRKLRGTKLTLSAFDTLAPDNNYVKYVTFMIDGDGNVTENNVNLTGGHCYVTGNITDGLTVYIDCNGNSDLYVGWIQLNIGDYIPHVREQYTDALSRCIRDCQVFRGFRKRGDWVAGNGIFFNIPLETMRDYSSRKVTLLGDATMTYQNYDATTPAGTTTVEYENSFLGANHITFKATNSSFSAATKPDGHITISGMLCVHCEPED